ncbi:MAG TPA: energy transducer TonB [Nevskiaceae bacterium]|nr:energy transducer TonB [Nevskiaceae bacterium]
MPRRTRLLLALLAALALHALLLGRWRSEDEQLPAGAGSGLGSEAADDQQDVTLAAAMPVAAGAGASATPPPAHAAPAGGGGGSGGYLARLRAHLYRYRSEPPAGISARGVAQVRFTVAADGSASGVDVAESSGSRELDLQAVALVLRASPLPAPPDGLAQTLVVPVEFR